MTEPIQLHYRHYHAARIAALRVAKAAGWLEGRTLQEIADALGATHRSEILRDLQQMDEYAARVDRYIAALENLKP